MRAPSKTVLKYCLPRSAVQISEADERVVEDVDDLVCLRNTFDKYPEAAKNFSRMARISEQWAEIVNFWDDLCFVHDIDDPQRKGKSRSAASMLNSLKTRVVL